MKLWFCGCDDCWTHENKLFNILFKEALLKVPTPIRINLKTKKFNNNPNKFLTHRCQTFVTNNYADVTVWKNSDLFFCKNYDNTERCNCAVYIILIRLM